MKSSAVSAGQEATATQYNDLRGDAKASSWLFPHEQSTPDMTLKVEGGTIYVGTTRVVYAGGNSPTFTAPVSNNRIDLLLIDKTGTLSVQQGTAAASPSVPTYPGDKAVICEVYVRSTSTTLRDTDGGAATGYIQRDVRPVMAWAPVTQDGGQLFTADSGSSDAYAANYDPVPVVANGLKLKFRAGTPNTGAATYSPNGATAKAIKKWSNGALTALATGDIVNGQMVEVMFDSAGDCWQLQSPIATPPTGDWQLLGTATLGGAATTITASGLATRKFLKVVCHVHDMSGSDKIAVRFNGDNSSIYGYRAYKIAAGSSYNIAGNDSMLLVDDVSDSNDFLLVMDIANTAAGEYKIVSFKCDRYSNNEHTVGGGSWGNTADLISSITVMTQGAVQTFGVGSVLYVYGSTD